MARIILDHVTIEFPVFTSHTRSIRTAVLSKLGGSLATHNSTVIVRALRDVSIQICDGDRVGLVGHNGAGKTTFLRVVSGVYPPLIGSATIEGKVSSFTDITLGMDPEATGWQNIIFRSVFLGLSFSDAQRLAPSVADFCELGPYMDLPVRTYSTGMFVRLAFAISTAVQPDVLIMDEMLSAGDQGFAAKALTRLRTLMERSRILIMASHNEEAIRAMCNKVIWLDKGEIKRVGRVQEVLQEYQSSVLGRFDGHATTEGTG